MSKEEEAKTKAPKKNLGKVGLLGFFAVVAAIIFMPTAIILMIGLLPTFVAAFAARADRGTKALTVGAMNLSGCVPFLLDLWTTDHSVPRALGMISDPRTVIVIYCAAGIGYLVDWAMGGIVNTVLVQRANGRLKEIKKRQGELVTRWGQEVTGDLPLDAYGFPIESKGSAALHEPD